MYNKRIWLNPEDHSSTASIVCYDGKGPFGDESPEDFTIVEIADCHNKVRLHKGRFETDKNFLYKLRKLNIELEEFITYFEMKQPKGE